MFICMFKHIDQGVLTKTLTIRDEVYNKLLTIKREGESFSELFERLADGSNPRKTLKDLRGCVEFSDMEGMLKEIYGARAERRT